MITTSGPVSPTLRLSFGYRVSSSSGRRRAAPARGSVPWISSSSTSVTTVRAPVQLLGVKIADEGSHHALGIGGREPVGALGVGGGQAVAGAREADSTAQMARWCLSRWSGLSPGRSGRSPAAHSAAGRQSPAPGVQQARRVQWNPPRGWADGTAAAPWAGGRRIWWQQAGGVSRRAGRGRPG